MLRRVLLVAAVAAALASPAAAAAAAPSDPLGGVLAAARDRGVPALVRVYATWCAPCAQLEVEVFDEARQDDRFQWVAVGAVDFDTDAGQVVTERYRVLNLPTVLVLSADGAEKGRVEGYEGSEPFLEALDLVLGGTEPLTDELRAVVAANPDVGAAWLDLGRRLLQREDPDEARAALDRAIRTDPSGEIGVAGAAYDLLARYFIRARTDYDLALQALAEARAWIGGTEAIPGLLWWYALACLRQGDVDDAEMTFHNYSAAHPYRVLPFLMRADFFEEHDLDGEQVERDLGVVGSMAPPADILSSAWHVRARLRKKQGRVAEARAAIDKALALEPEKALYLRFKAELGAP